ncbi:putative non-specific serine/threonine protein kinase [Helianthus annuus]|nr:putative non-specific serine/threonine protein kinase [Helianthus annuus]KAJ0759066.1 putative non-specific serine/threonine protein kinase [Helianthus annuus]KAJ0762718.1 putative non-specific serine/threonine protein kinase [Helianthus annuus]
MGHHAFEKAVGTTQPRHSHLHLLRTKKSHCDHLIIRSTHSGSYNTDVNLYFVCSYLEGNMLSGPFPTTLTKMTTLQTLVLEGNHFSGPLPKEIANLTYMIHLYLYFTFLVSIFML